MRVFYYAAVTGLLKIDGMEYRRVLTEWCGGLGATEVLSVT